MFMSNGYLPGQREFIIQVQNLPPAQDHTAIPSKKKIVALVTDFDWSTTPLGPMEQWPISLKTVVRMMLLSEFPQAIVWGPNFTTIHNEAFLPILGKKPSAIGRSFADVWSEAWNEIGAIAEKAYNGEPTFIENFPLWINRNGHEELAYFTFCYSPLLDDDGKVAGLIDTVMETTETVKAKQVEERLRIANRATNDAIWDWDFISGHVGWNEALTDAYGHRLIDVAPSGDWWIEHIHPDDRERIDRSIHAVIDGSEPSWTEEYRFQRADGTYAEVLDRGHVIRDDTGRALRMIGAMLDLTRVRQAEAALGISQQELVVERSLLRAVVQQAPIGISIAYADGHEEINARLEQMFGHTAREKGALRALGLQKPDDAMSDKPLSYRNEETGELRRFEVTTTPISGEDGSTLATVALVIDVEDRTKAEEHRTILNRELSHRLKNTLAVVQSVATQTLRGAIDIRSAQQTLAQRIGALSAAHDILLTGHQDTALVSDLVNATMSIHADKHRVRASGPQVRLGSSAGLTFSLILHELATNAVKYGSLSNENGHVEVTWSILHSAQGSGRELFEFRWQEIGGPPVKVPEKRSFGSRLIEIGLSRGEHAGAVIDYLSDGLRCRITAPLDVLQEEKGLRH